MALIFIIEDDAPLREGLVRLLDLHGHECVCCESFPDAADDALAANADCVLLDLSLPGAFGHQICRDIRRDSDVPVIVVTSSDSEFDEVLSLDVGADDYVTKPYRPAALLARIERALARRQDAEATTSKALEVGGVSLDPSRGEVSFGNETCELTRNELRILHVLMQSAGEVITRAELMEELWQTDSFVDDNTLTVNINRLRRSLENIGVPGGFVETKRGQGYLVRP